MFKTATQLGITEAEHTALIRTIDVLKGEQIVFDMGTQCNVRTEDGSFNTVNKPWPVCQTNCCIGGAMSLLMQNGMELPALVTPEMGDKMVTYVDEIGKGSSSALEPLFWDKMESDVPPKAGIGAIERFMSGNTKDPWLLAD